MLFCRLLNHSLLLICFSLVLTRLWWHKLWKMAFHSWDVNCKMPDCLCRKLATKMVPQDWKLKLKMSWHCHSVHCQKKERCDRLRSLALINSPHSIVWWFWVHLIVRCTWNHCEEQKEMNSILVILLHHCNGWQCKNKRIDDDLTNKRPRTRQRSISCDVSHFGELIPKLVK